MLDRPWPALLRATSYPRRSTPSSTRTAITLPQAAAPARPPLRPVLGRGHPSCCRARSRGTPATSLPPVPAVSTRPVLPEPGSIRRAASYLLGLAALVQPLTAVLMDGLQHHEARLT